MPQELLYPTVLESRGPWLIGSRDLLALDEIFDQINGNNGSRNLKIFLPKERELKASSFKEAMSHVGSQDEIATGFRYELKTRDAEVSVRLLPLNQREKEKGEFRPKLEMRVGPEGTPASQEIMGLLKAWIADVEPPVWKKWLLWPRQFARFILVFVLVLGLFAFFNKAPSANDFKETYKQQAQELLRNGVNQQNQARAIELILALQSDFIPPGATAKHSPRAIAVFLIVVFILVIISATPAFCLGIWKGKQRLRFWESWFKINYFTIPTLIATSVFWPQLVSVVERAFRP